MLLDPKLDRNLRVFWKREPGPEAAAEERVQAQSRCGGSSPYRMAERRLLDPSILAKRLFQVVAAPPENIQFLYAIFDEGSWPRVSERANLKHCRFGNFQWRSAVSLLCQTYSLRPQSTIRMEVREVSIFRASSHVALHGYKVLGGARHTYRARFSERAGRDRAGDEAHHALGKNHEMPTPSRFVPNVRHSAGSQNISMSRELSRSAQMLAKLSSWPASSLPLNTAACSSIFRSLQTSTPGPQRKSQRPDCCGRILVNNRPLYPYLNFDRIVNPWGYGSFQISIRLDDSATIEFVVRRVATQLPNITAGWRKNRGSLLV